jgi:hypothetical protein
MLFRSLLGRRDLTLSELAKAAHMKLPTLQTYYSGRTVPTLPVVQKLAKILSGGQQGEAEQIVAQYRELTAGRRPLTRVGELIEGLRPLRMGQMDYPPVTGKAGAFVQELIATRVFGQLPGGPPECLVYDRVSELQQALARNRLDLLVHLITVERQFRFRFVIKFPLRISLGGIVTARHRSKIPAIQRVLWLGREAESDFRIRPVVVDQEVGWLHCANRLGFDPPDLDSLETLDPERIATELVERDLDSPPGVIHVAVLDELSHLRVLSKMAENGTPGLPVIPLTTEESVRSHTCNREMPMHHLGLAVRHESELGGFLSSALETHAATEIETVSHLIARLANQLYDLVYHSGASVPIEFLTGREVDRSLSPAPAGVRGHAECEIDHRREAVQRQSLARRWVRYALHLSEDDIEGENVDSYWRPILRRARQKLQAQTATESWHQILGFVKEVGDRVRWYRAHRIAWECSKEFDVALSQPDDSVGASALPWTYQIESQLVEGPIQPLLASIVRAGEIRARSAAIREILNELWLQLQQKAAQRSGFPEDLKRIIACVEGRAGEPQRFVVLLEVLPRAGSESPDPAGLLVARYVAADELDLEVLFVRGRWRGYGLTRRLIEDWQDAAGGNDTDARIRLAVGAQIPLNHMQFVLLKQLGFRAVDTHNPDASEMLQWP